MDDKTKLRAKDDLARLKGRAPYNTPDNFCYNDGHYANSLVQEYGMSISELEREVRK